MKPTSQIQNFEQLFKMRIFYFVCGLVFFAMAFTIFLIMFLPKAESTRIADTAMIFWLSTAVSGGLGYLLGGTVTPIKKDPPGGPATMTADISATVTTEQPPTPPTNT